MTPHVLRRTGLLLRILLYLAVILALWRILPRAPRSPDEEPRLRIVGGDLAPDLVGRLVERYVADYPGIEIVFEAGGTRHALEALGNGRADVGFTLRAPSAEEQALFRDTLRDTLVCFPVASGDLLLLRGDPSADTSVDTEGLRGFLRGDREPPAIDRLFASDPDIGVWQEFARLLEVPLAEAPGPRLVFVADDAAVADAVRSDARSLGVASSFALGNDLAEPDEPPAVVEIGALQLFASCLSGAGGHAAMFVTHLTSPRGQRQVEDAGFLPAQPIVREVHLTRHPVGK